MGLCFVFNGKPILQLDTRTTNNKKSIKLSISDKILYFIDDHIDICGQYKYQDDDRNFYQDQDLDIDDEDLLKLVKKCYNILHDIYDNKINDDDDEPDEEKMNIDINNIKKFIDE